MLCCVMAVMVISIVGKVVRLPLALARGGSEPETTPMPPTARRQVVLIDGPALVGADR